MCFCSFDIEAYTMMYLHTSGTAQIFIVNQKVTLQGSNCAKEKLESD